MPTAADIETGSKPFAVWITGISATGKSTLAAWLAQMVNGVVIDGDDLRKDGSHLPQHGHPFAREARRMNVRRATNLAQRAMEDGYNAFVALISPDRDEREHMVKALGYNVLVVLLQAPLNVLEAREYKGIYRRARLKEIKNVCGIDYLYEMPGPCENALKIDTSVICPGCAGRMVLQAVRRRGWLPLDP
jgi:bifunctional enzyme CysN/CysC